MRVGLRVDLSLALATCALPRLARVGGSKGGAPARTMTCAPAGNCGGGVDNELSLLTAGQR